MNYFPQNQILITLVTENIETYYCRTDLFKYSFFPYVIVKWYKRDINLRNSKSFLIFRNSLLKIEDHYKIQFIIHMIQWELSILLD